LKRAFGGLSSAVNALLPVLGAAREGAVPPELLSTADAALVKAKLDYLTKHVPRAIDQSLDGLARIASIVQAMKEFSHPSGTERQPVNIHEAIETTATVARNEWKYVATLQFDFEEGLPAVPLLRNEFNQVVLNLIVNAAHAIQEIHPDGTREKGKICIRTRRVEDDVEIRVSDTGGGIPEKIRARVFDPFFTTKPVGKGTGQGLAIAYSVIVDKHRGSIQFESREGVGTTFIIRLPLARDEATPSSQSLA
jgi:signal transduction histidine kinase